MFAPGAVCATLSGGELITVTILKFYVSNVRLLRQGKVIWSEPRSYHLLDAEDTATLRLALQAPKGLRYDEVRYTLGIDSATNAAGAQGGDLDATRGMYWAWHSGYINAKIEGTCPALASRSHRFEYHLGGFGTGKNCAVEMKTAARFGQDVVVQIVLDAFFKEIATAGLPPSIMTPGAPARQLSVQFSNVFQPVAR